jgi:integrase
MLSDKQIKNAKPADKNYKLFDGEGLFILIHAKGGKYWRLKYRYAGSEKEMSLGVYPDVSLADARKKRMELKLMLLDGKNPTTTKPTQTSTFKDDALEWFEMRKSDLAASTLKKNLERLHLHVFPIIGKMASSIIEPEHIIEMGKNIEAKGVPHTAKRCITLVSQIFRWLVIQRRIKTNPAYDLTSVIRNVEKKNNPYLREHELHDFLKALHAYPQTSSQLAARFLLLTMVRTSEMRFAKWSEIDFIKKQWRIPAERMKMRREHIVPLSNQAIDILHQAKIIADDFEYIFTSESKRKKVVSENAVTYVIKKIGYHGRVTGHGFRSTASTILNEHSFNDDAIERQLAHVMGGVRGVYNHAKYLPERVQMMQWWADFLDAQRML